jgi:hypothetical protein
MLGAVITPFLVVERNGCRIGDKDKANTRRWRDVYNQFNRAMRCEYGKVRRGWTFFHGDVVVTGISVVVRRESRRCKKVRRGRSTVGAKLEVNHAISGL